MVLEEEVVKLLNDPDLLAIEDEIARIVNCTIYDHPIFVKFEQKNIEDSALSVEKIKHHLSSNKKTIIDFATILLSQDGPTKSIARGASITYSIYLIYIDEMPTKLLEYIKKRRIPKAKKVAMEFIAIKKLIDR